MALLAPLVGFIAVLLLRCAARFQLAFERVAQQPEESLTIDLRQSLPRRDDQTGIGRGGAVLAEGLDMGHHLPYALRLGLRFALNPGEQLQQSTDTKHRAWRGGCQRKCLRGIVIGTSPPPIDVVER